MAVRCDRDNLLIIKIMTKVIIKSKVEIDIKTLRFSKEITLRRFCKDLDLDPSNYSKMERGLMDIPERTYNKILEYISNYKLVDTSEH